MRPHKRTAVRIGALLVVAMLAAWLAGVRSYAFPGESMASAVRPGDHFVGLAGPWRLRAPKRFDLVIFDVPATSGCRADLA